MWGRSSMVAREEDSGFGSEDKVAAQAVGALSDELPVKELRCRGALNNLD